MKFRNVRDVAIFAVILVVSVMLFANFLAELQWITSPQGVQTAQPLFPLQKEEYFNIFERRKAVGISCLSILAGTLYLVFWFIPSIGENFAKGEWLRGLKHLVLFFDTLALGATCGHPLVWKFAKFTLLVLLGLAFLKLKLSTPKTKLAYVKANVPARVRVEQLIVRMPYLNLCTTLAEPQRLVEIGIVPRVKGESPYHLNAHWGKKRIGKVIVVCKHVNDRILEL